MKKKVLGGLFGRLGAGLVVAALAIALGTCRPAAPGGPPGGTAPAPTRTLTAYTVLTWNDLGMHCTSPAFDQIVILPPYNNLRAQVIQRGNPPQLVTTGITVSYRIDNNTHTYGKGRYSSFWDRAASKMASTPPAKDIGLAGKGLSGTMDLNGSYFEANGIPISPIRDDNIWTPYQTGVVTVKDATGDVLVETRTTVPVSDEMNCARCHVGGFSDILASHIVRSGLMGPTPVICSSCHADSALGTSGTPGVESLSLAMHKWHSTVTPAPACYDCHPGALTQCNRSTRHTAADGNCTTCHGTLTDLASGLTTGRQPWLQEPACVTCHTGVPEVDTGTALFRNSAGHGGISCEGCHGSPHAMLPTNQVPNYPNIDAWQVQQYAAPKPKTLGSCGACHPTSLGLGAGGDYASTHGSLNPEVRNGCDACHTAMSTTTTSWPHQYMWHDSGN